MPVQLVSGPSITVHEQEHMAAAIGVPTPCGPLSVAVPWRSWQKMSHKRVLFHLPPFVLLTTPVSSMPRFLSSHGPAMAPGVSPWPLRALSPTCARGRRGSKTQRPFPGQIPWVLLCHLQGGGRSHSPLSHSSRGPSSRHISGTGWLGAPFSFWAPDASLCWLAEQHLQHLGP